MCSGIPIQAEKGGYKHFMLKEIWEQPRAVTDTTLGRVSLDSGKVFLGEMEIADEELERAESINIAACGTSWHAALTGKYMIERLARLPVDVDYASEYRYRDPIAGPDALGLLDYAVGRNGRHAGGAARDECAGIEDRGHLQRGGGDGGARGARRDLHACGAGDWRGLDEGVYGATDGAVPARAEAGAVAREAGYGAVGGVDGGAGPRAGKDRGGAAGAVGAVARHWPRSLRRRGTFCTWDAGFIFPLLSKAR